jgi:hypothetical protein
VLGAPELRPGAMFFLIRNEALVGPVTLLPDNRAIVASAEEAEEHVHDQEYYVVVAHQRPLQPPFHRTRGHMWQKSVPYLEGLADRIGDDRRSTVFVFEDGRQLPLPHTTHDDIDRYGQGRFSHWGQAIYFSSSDQSDPNDGRHSYCLLVANEPMPEYVSMAALFGHAVVGPFEQTPAGWTGSVRSIEKLNSAGDLVLIRNDDLAGAAEVDANGRVVIASPEHPEEVVLKSVYSVVSAECRQLEAPFRYERGLMWSKSCPELKELADGMTKNDSPVFVFQGNRQLPAPHSPHDDIAALGGGRFSHWGEDIHFSTIESADPNGGGRAFTLLVPRRVDNS